LNFQQNTRTNSDRQKCRRRFLRSRQIVETSETGTEEKPARKKKPKPKTPPTTGKTEAEKRIEQIREEVEKVLDRLGQMEVET